MSLAAIDIEQSRFSDEHTGAIDVGLGASVADRSESAASKLVRSGRIQMYNFQDDPVLVSDGDALWNKDTAFNLLREVLSRQPQGSIASTAASIITYKTSENAKFFVFDGRERESKYVSDSTILSHFYGSEVIVEARRTAESWRAFTWLQEPSTAQIDHQRHLSHQAASAHYLPLMELLDGEGFSHDPPHKDIFGGQVMDFVRGDERISMALQDDTVQIMTYMAGEFHNKSFEGLEKSKIHVLDYVTEFLA